MKAILELNSLSYNRTRNTLLTTAISSPGTVNTFWSVWAAEESYQGSLPAKAWYASSLDLGPFSCRLGTPKLSPSTYKLILGVSNEEYTGPCGLCSFSWRKRKRKGGWPIARYKLLGGTFISPGSWVKLLSSHRSIACKLMTKSIWLTFRFHTSTRTETVCQSDDSTLYGTTPLKDNILLLHYPVLIYSAADKISFLLD